MKIITTSALLTAFLASCASTTTNSAAPDQASAAVADSEGDENDKKQRKLEELERRIHVKTQRLEIARAEADAQALEHDLKLKHEQIELEMAQAKLAAFREVDSPQRVAQEQLNLRSAKDRAQEAADELAQIEIMYEDQDLDDLTAEFVVSRGRRSAERAAARIQIQEAAFRSLEERELPQEQKRLQLAVDRAVAGLQKAKRDGELRMREKALSILESENALIELQQELTDLREELAEGADA